MLKPQKLHGKQKHLKKQGIIMMSFLKSMLNSNRSTQRVSMTKKPYLFGKMIIIVCTPKLLQILGKKFSLFLVPLTSIK